MRYPHFTSLDVLLLVFTIIMSIAAILIVWDVEWA